MADKRGQSWEVIADAVRLRDNHRCRRCSATREVNRNTKFVQTTLNKCPGDPGVVQQYKRKLAVHHIIPEHAVPTDQDPHHSTNLVTLCASCHVRLELRNIGKQLDACGIRDIEAVDIDKLELETDSLHKVRQKIRRLSTRPPTEYGELPSPVVEFVYGLTDQTQLSDYHTEGIQRESNYERYSSQVRDRQATLCAF